MVKHGVEKSDLYDLKPGPGLPNLAHDILGVYEETIRPENKFLKASHIMAQIHYRQIVAVNYDVFDKRMALPPPFKALRLALSYKFL